MTWAVAVLLPLASFHDLVSPLHADDALKLQLATAATVMKRLQAGAVQQRERQQTIETLFKESGCPATLERVDHRSANVVCKLPGKTAATIVAGAHYDFTSPGEGMVDDWSGAAMLVSLFETVKAQRPEHSFVFIAFAAKERDLEGSSRYVKNLGDEERSGVRAFVNLQCLGLSMPKVWVRRSTPMLLERWAETATAAKIPVSGVNVQELEDDDTHAFAAKNIPVISIHSLAPDTFKIPHSKEDNAEAIRAQEYYDSYRVIALYLTYLDGELQK